MTEEESSKKAIIKKTATTNFEIHPLIKERWSPRMYSDKAIVENDLKQLFEAARWAASSYNYQPWRFIYTHKDQPAYKTIFNCLADFNKQWAGQAAVLILAVIKEKKEDGKDNYHALHDLGLSVGNLSLQAQSMGIALHQMAGIDAEKVQKKFSIPNGYHVVSAIAAGYFGGDINDLPADLLAKEKEERSRKKLSEIASAGEWSKEF